MKRMKKLSIILLSLSISNAIGCGWFPTGEEFRFALFQSNLAGHNDAYGLFYSAHFLNQYSPIVTTGPEENLKAWQSHLGGTVPLQDIDELVYKAEDHHLEQLIRRQGEGVKIYGSNKMLKAIPKKERIGYLEYILFARNIEIVFNNHDPWGEVEFDYESLQTYFALGAKKVKSERNKELKIRYAYQCVLLSRYAGGDENVVKANEIYDEYLADSEHVLKYWALMHKTYTATAYGASYESFVINYAKAFRNCDSKKSYIALNTNLSDAYMPKILEACANDAERADVIALGAFRNPGKAFEQINKVYQLDPASPLLGLLIIREVNKLEDWYLTKKNAGYESGVYSSCWACEEQLEFIQAKNFHSDKLYLKKIAKFMDDLNLEATGNAQLFNTIRAYLRFMNDEDAAADEILNGILSQELPLDPSLEGQIRALQLLLSVRSDQAVESEIVEHLNWLESHKTSIYNYDRFKDQLMLALSNRFHHENHNIAKAALCRSQVETLWNNKYNVWGKQAYFFYLDQFASPKDVELFISFLDNDDSVFIAYLAKDLLKDRNKLLDLLGTKYLREDELKMALDIYRSIDTAFWNTGHYPEMLDCDPFYSEYYENHTAIEGNKTYTKPEFVARLIELTDKARSGEKHAAYYNFLLGNAYFNMTKYGNSWYYGQYAWSVSDNYDPEYYDDAYYYDCSKAKFYYLSAYDASKDKAYAAFCLRMVAKCEYYYANHVYDQHVRVHGSWDNYKDVSGLKNMYRKIKNEFPEDYDNLVRTCSFFDMYLDRWRYS